MAHIVIHAGKTFTNAVLPSVISRSAAIFFPDTPVYLFAHEMQGSFPSLGYRFISAWGVLTTLDIILILIIDLCYQRWEYGGGQVCICAIWMCLPRLAGDPRVCRCVYTGRV